MTLFTILTPQRKELKKIQGIGLKSVINQMFLPKMPPNQSLVPIPVQSSHSFKSQLDFPFFTELQEVKNDADPTPSALGISNQYHQLLQPAEAFMPLKTAELGIFPGNQNRGTISLITHARAVRELEGSSSFSFPESTEPTGIPRLQFLFLPNWLPSPR